jgi:hypothetical protein
VRHLGSRFDIGVEMQTPRVRLMAHEKVIDAHIFLRPAMKPGSKRVLEMAGRSFLRTVAPRLINPANFPITEAVIAFETRDQSSSISASHISRSRWTLCRSSIWSKSAMSKSTPNSKKRISQIGTDIDHPDSSLRITPKISCSTRGIILV